jgi:hypothetical protein
MKARLEAMLRRLGAPGVLGIGVLLACAGFYATALAPVEKEAVAQRVALERLRARTPHQPVSSGGRADELRRFYNLFPPAGALTDEMERLDRLARSSGVELSQGEYRLERRAAGLWAYRATLPVRGSYPELRNFLAAVMKQMPTASIDALRFERKKAAETQLEAQVRVTLYARPPGDQP